MKKPTKRIVELIEEKMRIKFEELTPDRTNEVLAYTVTSIGDYLDEIIPELQKQIEELQKPKYACPCCHRIVDELIMNPMSDKERNIFANFINGCKHCMEQQK